MKNLFLLLFITNINISFAQNDSIKATKLLNLIQIDGILNAGYNSLKEETFSKIDSIFTSNKIPIDETHINAYKNKINVDFNDQIEMTKTKLHYYYSDIGSEKLDSYLSFIKTNKNYQQIIEKIDFFTFFEPIFADENYAFNQRLENIIETTKQLGKPLVLQLKINNKIISNYSNIDFELYLNTTNKNFKKIKLLNKSNGEIIVPADLKNEEIQYLTIVFKNKEKEFFNPRVDTFFKVIPNSQEIIKSLDSLRPECMKKEMIWKIEICDDEKIIKELKIKEEHEISEKVYNFMSINTCSETFIYNF